MFSLWDTKREEIDQFILEANRHHPTIKFTAEISEEKTNFLDTTIFKGERFYKDSIFDIDIRTQFKPTETFQYTHFSSCHAPAVKKGFIKGEALRLLIEPTLQRQHLKKTLKISDHTCVSEAIQIFW